MLAVKLYGQLDSSEKPAGMPDNWPAQCIELHNNESAFDDTWIIMSKDEYTAWKLDNQAAYNAWYQSTLIPPDAAALLLAAVKAKVEAARVFGVGLISEYGASNIIAQFNLSQIQEIMVRLSKVLSALQTGSLYVAIAEINAVETDSVIITDAKVQIFRNKIEDYLGIPRT